MLDVDIGSTYVTVRGSRGEGGREPGWVREPVGRHNDDLDNRSML